MVKWYKTYLEVYGKSFDEISDDSIHKVKRQLKESRAGKESHCKESRASKEGGTGEDNPDEALFPD